MRKLSLTCCLISLATALGCSADPASHHPDAAPVDGAAADLASSDLASASADTAPGASSSSPFGFHPASANNYQYAKDLNIVWSREGMYLVWDWIDPGRAGQPRFDHAVAPAVDGMQKLTLNYDQQWLKTPNNVNLVVNICPFRRGGAFAGAGEENNYREFVRRAVERYDGDGELGCTRSAPDCYVAGDKQYPRQAVIDRFKANPIKHWQVCNQVTDGCSGIACKSTYAATFARIQELTYKGVKAGDAAASVLIAGDSARWMYPPVYEALKGHYVDIVDFHRFGRELIYDPKADFDFLKDRLKKAGFDPSKLEFWITETGTYSGDPVDDASKALPYQSEEQQARGLLKIYISALGYGIERVFWAWNILEGFGCDCCIFDYTGIVYDGNQGKNSDNCEKNDPYDKGLNVKKLAYYTYKQMVARLAGAAWDRIETVERSNQLFVYRFPISKTGRSVWVAWSETQRAYTLAAVSSSEVEVVSSVPAATSGADVDGANYLTSFSTQKRTVVDHAVALTLGPTPVYIVEK
jgi:hypothetical protein